MLDKFLTVFNLLAFLGFWFYILFVWNPKVHPDDCDCIEELDDVRTNI